jgi:hypothetical protein
MLRIDDHLRVAFVEMCVSALWVLVAASGPGFARSYLWSERSRSQDESDSEGRNALAEHEDLAFCVPRHVKTD